MNRSIILLATFAVVFSLSGLPLFAQHGGGRAGGGGFGHGMGGPNSGGGPKTPGKDRDMDSSMRGAKTPSELLMHNTRLASKLLTLLKEQSPPITDLQGAASGFKNLGQFVAAVHVSHNLGIPFQQLKGKLVGATAESLGKAIRDIKPEVNVKAETKKAHKQANDDLNEAES